MAQKKLVNQKITGIAQVAGKGGVATQVIVGSKPLSTAMTMQQFQQVIRSPLTVPQGPVVLAKAQPRVIPVNTGQGGKQTIQVRKEDTNCGNYNFVMCTKCTCVFLLHILNV